MMGGLTAGFVTVEGLLIAFPLASEGVWANPVVPSAITLAGVAVAYMGLRRMRETDKRAALADAEQKEAAAEAKETAQQTALLTTRGAETQQIIDAQNRTIDRLEKSEGRLRGEVDGLLDAAREARAREDELRAEVRELRDKVLACEKALQERGDR